jgi:hypothetical protein
MRSTRVPSAAADGRSERRHQPAGAGQPCSPGWPRKPAPVFVVATANAVERLPAELLRKGRFDEIFLLDLPSSWRARRDPRSAAAPAPAQHQIPLAGAGRSHRRLLRGRAGADRDRSDAPGLRGGSATLARPIRPPPPPGWCRCPAPYLGAAGGSCKLMGLQRAGPARPQLIAAL